MIEQIVSSKFLQVNSVVQSIACLAEQIVCVKFLQNNSVFQSIDSLIKK